MNLLVAIIVLLVLFGGLGGYGYRSGLFAASPYYGYGGGLSLVVILIVVFLLFR